MSNAERKRKTSISKADTIEKMAEFWDTHSVDEFWDQTQPASFEVRGERRRRVTIDPEIYAQIEEVAHRRGVSSETLINLWLVGHLKEIQSAQKMRKRRRKE